MKKSVLALLVPLIGGIPTTSHAGFIDNYSLWRGYSERDQMSYLIGALDSWSQPTGPEDEAWRVARRTGVSNCMLEQNITVAMLLEIVNGHYKDFKADWRISPSSVLVEELQGICLLEINKARKAGGLEPWERNPRQITKDTP